MEEHRLDYVLVPLGLVMMGLYHCWLPFNIRRFPRRTVIGSNAESRHQWVQAMMLLEVITNVQILLLHCECEQLYAKLCVCGRVFMWPRQDGDCMIAKDPLKNGVLAVQTICNNIMASTLLATTAITLSSLISVFVSSTSSSSKASNLLYGSKSSVISSIKYFTILLCFLVAFLCNVQSIRYYAHVSFLVTVPSSKDNKDSIEYVIMNLNRGSFFWSLGLRAFYISFPLFLWIFGPIPMFACCCAMTFILYFLDTTTSFTHQLHTHSFKEETNAEDLESAGQPS